MTILTLAEALGQYLKQENLKLVTAESCTGGGLAYAITRIAGSSAWFERGLVTYSNQAKIELLDVQSKTIETHGAVSEETAREMAIGALKHSHASISIAITGIAGPSGGTAEKPVGLVWIAWATSSEIQTYQFIFEGNREEIREKTIEQALKLLRHTP